MLKRTSTTLGLTQADIQKYDANRQRQLQAQQAAQLQAQQAKQAQQQNSAQSAQGSDNTQQTQGADIAQSSGNAHGPVDAEVTGGARQTQQDRILGGR